MRGDDPQCATHTLAPDWTHEFPACAGMIRARTSSMEVRLSRVPRMRGDDPNAGGRQPISKENEFPACAGMIRDHHARY